MFNIKNVTLLILILSMAGCSSFQAQQSEGEYRYVPTTDKLKKLPTEEFRARLRIATLTCENDMLQVAVPSKSVDPDGWEQGRRDRRKYFVNCLELKGFKREFFSGKALKDQKAKENRRMTNEEYIKKPRFL